MTTNTTTTDNLRHFIHTIRGCKVILDADLARIYGVQTKALNQAVKRNRQKFPEDFMFRIFFWDLKPLAFRRRGREGSGDEGWRYVGK